MLSANHEVNSMAKTSSKAATSSEAAFLLAVDRFNAGVCRFCNILALLMAVVGAGNAILRYVGSAIGKTLISNAYTEIQWYCFAAVFLLSAPHVLRMNKHVRVDVIYSRLSKSNQMRVDLFGGVIFLIPFCTVGLWASWSFVENSWSILEWSKDVGGLPRFPVKSLIPLSFVLLCLQAYSEIARKASLLSITWILLPVFALQCGLGYFLVDGDGGSQLCLALGLGALIASLSDRLAIWCRVVE